MQIWFARLELDIQQCNKASTDPLLEGIGIAFFHFSTNPKEYPNILSDSPIYQKVCLPGSQSNKLK